MATASDTTSDTSSSGQDGPGTPGEGLVALVTELAKAPPGVKPDPEVPRAIAAGWHAREALAAARKADGTATEDEANKQPVHAGHAVTAMENAVEELAHAFLVHPVAEDKPAPLAPPTFVPNGSELFARVSDLPANDRVTVVCAQLSSDLAALTKTLKSAGQDPAPIADAIAGVASAKGQRHEDAAYRLGSQLGYELLAADFRLGKAYALGWDMAALNEVEGLTDAAARARFIERFELAHDPIVAHLTDLASLLPPNAGHAVRASVQTWAMVIARNDGSLKQVTRDTIFEQVQTWRTLLTAEKAAKDVLDGDSLVAISAGTMSRLAEAVRDGAKETKGALTLLAIVVILLVVVGIALIAVTGGTATNVAGVTALVGSLGLTWKGVGSTIGRGLAKLEQPAWDAQVDHVIGTVITTLPMSE